MPNGTKVFCCKKWVAGELKKFYSQRRCGEGSVPCDTPDPPKPPDIIDEGTCEDNCRSDQQYLLLKGPSPERAQAMLDECLAKCAGVEPGDCEGGYEMPFGASTCREGFTGKKIGLKNMCCPETGPEPGKNPCTGTGGYQLTQETGFPGGQGAGKSPWAEVPGTERSSDWEAHFVWDPAKGKYVNVFEPETGYDLVCRKDYQRTTGADGSIWCCPAAGDGGGVGGQFAWSPELQGLMSRIMERANQLLDYPRGLTPQERQAVINYAIEGVKAGERGQKRTTQESLSRMGLLGGGYEATEMARIEREKRQEAGGVRRELAIDELNRRFSEIMGTTGMVQGLTGTLMTGEQIPEVLSGARRTEGQAAINALLSFWGGQMGGQDNTYWQAILNRLLSGQGQGGGADLSWLYYLPYLTSRTR